MTANSSSSSTYNKTNNNSTADISPTNPASSLALTASVLSTATPASTKIGLNH
ncbi:hypothetical protein K457DRAFT_141941 [Linnemannia elongata AG-77]|uniref:Uncharacterized protein n=1 Tax=Linnemannia elongata AG-77 TaxID=1314771 RepID=A0A197JH26_9FUNG|nr:hypothetical protein K457DRAFT_141941 [Linnemannia elongata AG-77]